MQTITKLPASLQKAINEIAMNDAHKNKLTPAQAKRVKAAELMGSTYREAAIIATEVSYNPSEVNINRLEVAKRASDKAYYAWRNEID